MLTVCLSRNGGLKVIRVLPIEVPWGYGGRLAKPAPVGG